MITPDEAAQLCQVSSRTIYRRIESGRLHFAETEKGFALVCLQSLGSETEPSVANGEALIRMPARKFSGKAFMKRMLRRR